MSEMTPAQEAAAWHGLATNPTLPIGERLECALKALDWYAARVEAAQGDDPWRLTDWDALPEECFVAACDNTDIDQRAPVWLRGGGMAKACVEHWEGVQRVLGDQASWERDAARFGSGGAA